MSLAPSRHGVCWNCEDPQECVRCLQALVGWMSEVGGRTQKAQIARDMVLRGIFESVLACMAGHPRVTEVYGRVGMGLPGPRGQASRLKHVCNCSRGTGGTGLPRVSCKSWGTASTMWAHPCYCYCSAQGMHMQEVATVELGLCKITARTTKCLREGMWGIVQLVICLACRKPCV